MNREKNAGLVSIIVASYNHVAFLHSRMNSLLAQTYSKIEIIVIDDNSSDGSWEFLQKYVHDPRISLVQRRANGGWVEVSNQGAALAKGEYILFANCDDACDPDMVSHLVAAIENKPGIGLAFSRSDLINEVGEIVGNDFEAREPDFKIQCQEDALIPRAEMCKFLLHSCVIPNLSAALIRRSAFFQSGGFSKKFRACSDWELFFRLGEQSDFFYVAKPLNKFRQHGRTIRNKTKGRIAMDEYFTILLGAITKCKLTPFELLRHRTHVMYLWVVELLRPSFDGWLNFAHHLRLAWQLDAKAVAHLPLAILVRIAEVPVKLWAKITGSP